MRESTLKLLNSSNPDDILLGLALREFTSSNNITMIKGRKYNWEKQSKYYNNTGPISLGIYLGSLGEYIQANWHIQDDKCIYLSNGRGTLKFYCESIDRAEELISMYIKANNIDLGPLYII